MQFRTCSPDCSFDDYRPLSQLRNEIRLLIVEPGIGLDPIIGRFQHATLDHELLKSYETISYVWGTTSEKSGWIVLNSIFVIPICARNAIRRMRLPDQERVLWIDAVCINQLDIQERNRQVTLTELVYSMASANLIYFGEDEGEAAKRAVDTLHKTAQWLRDSVDKLSDARARTFFETFGLFPEAMHSQAMSADTLRSLFPLYELAWFRSVQNFKPGRLLLTLRGRLWVWQEAALASQNICFWGDVNFAFEDVLTCAILHVNALPTEVYKQYYSLGYYYPYALKSIVRNRTEFVFKKKLLPFDQVCSLNSFLQVTEPRDQSLLGLVYTVDITRSTPYQSFYGRTMRNLLLMSSETQQGISWKKPWT